jgi:hypothetical protein
MLTEASAMKGAMLESITVNPAPPFTFVMSKDKERLVGKIKGANVGAGDESGSGRETEPVPGAHRARQRTGGE